MYIGLENEAKVQAIDTAENKVVATIPIGQLPQALVYVSGVTDKTMDSRAADNLLPLSTLKESKTCTLIAKDKKDTGRATVTVISLGLIDELQVAASGLAPGEEYTLSLVRGTDREPLVKAKAGAAGNLIADTLGPMRGLPPSGSGGDQSEKDAIFVLEPIVATAGSMLVQTPP